MQNVCLVVACSVHPGCWYATPSGSKLLTQYFCKIVAFFDSLLPRLLGICCASLSSGEDAYKSPVKKNLRLSRSWGANFSSTFNNLFSHLHRWPKRWVGVNLTTCPSPSTTPCSYFASGTGAAGLVGAFLWWEVRGLGVRLGVGLSAVRSSIHRYCNANPLSFSVHAPSNTHHVLLPSAQELRIPIVSQFASRRRSGTSSLRLAIYSTRYCRGG